MTSLNTSLDFKVRVTGVEGESFYALTCQEVKKPVADILYLESPPKDAVKLAFVGSKEIDATRDIKINDRSSLIYENTIGLQKIEFIADTRTVNVRTKNFIVTQIFNNLSSGKLPLFFVHHIAQLFSEVSKESIRIFDKDMNPVDSNLYKVELIYDYNTETGAKTDPLYYAVYNSLNGSYDNITGEFNVFFLQYTDLSGTIEESKTILLENDYAYKEAGDLDWWYEGGTLKPWADAYTIDENTNLVTGSKPDSIAVRYLEERKLSVRTPTSIIDSLPWYLRLTNGSLNSGYEDYSSTYKITEFENQAFNPIEPYKFAARSRAKKINDYLIKLADEDIFCNAFYPIDIVVEDETGKVIYAITTNNSKVNTPYISFNGAYVYDSSNDPILWNSTLYRGMDKITGIVLLDIVLLDSYTVYSSYTYEEKYYTLSSLNMNPVFDVGAADEIRVVYLCPYKPEQTESVRWLKVDNSGRIIDTNQGPFGGNENIRVSTSLSNSYGFGLTGVLGLHYNWNAYSSSIETAQDVRKNAEIELDSIEGFPYSGWIRFIDNDGDPKYRYAFYKQRTLTGLVLSDKIPSPIVEGETVQIKPSTRVSLVNFIDERTILSSRISEDEWEYSYSSPPIHIKNRYFILAECSVAPPHSVNDSVIIDIRENGGNIKEDKYEVAKARDPKAQWLSEDNIDGQIYPGTACSVIKLPISIKKKFTEEQISTIVTENTPLGIVPIIKYYGHKPRITLIDVLENSIDVSWEKMGSEFGYRVLYSKKAEGPWYTHNTMLLNDSNTNNLYYVSEEDRFEHANDTDNIYRLDDLEWNTKYYIKIICIDKYFQWWYSYSGLESLDGGLYDPTTIPDPEWNNKLSFKLTIEEV
jgi:hypothetical protein